MRVNVKCEFESVDSACMRCQLRGLDCGRKLPPQQRPRSITSVPNDYRRPASLHIDTRMLNTNNSVTNNYTTSTMEENSPLLSPLVGGGLHSLPVSPYISPWNYHSNESGYLDPRSASITPIDGSPAPFTLEQFDLNSRYISTPPLTTLLSIYILLSLELTCRIGINLTTEEERTIENVFNMYNTSTTSATIAPMMSHQNSQQTITQQHQQQQSQFQTTPTSAPALNFYPVFDDDEMSEAAKSPADLERPTSRHVLPPFLTPAPVPVNYLLCLGFERAWLIWG